MSHVSSIQLIITDLDSLDQACSDLGHTLVRNATEFQAYYKEKCVHKISPKDGLGYDCGLRYAAVVDGEVKEVEQDKAQGFCLSWDNFRGKHGIDPNAIMQRYGVHVTKKKAAEQGYRVNEETLENGTVRLTVQVDGTAGAGAAAGSTIGSPASW